jgi:hypothetical protein
VGLLGAGTALRLQLAFDDTRKLRQLGMILDLLPVARVGVDDEVLAVEDPLLHLGHDLGQRERAEVQAVFLHEPALVLLGDANRVGNAE